MVKRKEYLSCLRLWLGKDVVKVITGVRRCGKSTLMDQRKADLQAQGVDPCHIVHINLELMENEPLLEYHALHDAVLSRCSDDDLHYVLLDKVQNIPDFQKAIDSLYAHPNIDLYITGSNAYLLSGTLATLLSGRYVEIKVLPFSFTEYREAHKGEATQARMRSNFLHDGSFPADRYDIREKRIMKQEKKYYAVDLGLRRVLCSNTVRDTGRMLENLVFLELIRREKNVYVGQGLTGEIDFVTNGPEGIKYWQVSESVANEETLQRELSSLTSVRDNYPKTLIALDDEREQSLDGIRKVYALDWLAEKHAKPSQDLPPAARYSLMTQLFLPAAFAVHMASSTR